MAPENRRRAAIAGLALSAAGLVAIVGQEGYSSKATIPVAGDVPTIGFGTTAGVRLGDTTTPQRALGRALRDISTFEGALKQCMCRWRRGSMMLLWDWPITSEGRLFAIRGWCRR
jgi:lysozyme